MNIPWRSAVEDFTLARAGQLGQANEKQPLKLGIFWTDGAVQPQPPITRGLHVVAREVEKAGHKACSQNDFVCILALMFPFQIFNWEPPSQSTAKRVHVSLENRNSIGSLRSLGSVP